MPPDQEKELYQQWDRALDLFFEGLQSPAPPSRVDETGDPSQGEVRSYRSRVGQDLQSFHQKLANIMESEKSGQ